MLKKLEKNTQAYNYKLNQFMNYGLQYYVDLVKIKRPSLCSRICAVFTIRSNRSSLNEITKNLKNGNLDEAVFTNILVSPMEEAPDLYSEASQQLLPSPSLPDNCQTADPNKVSVVFEMGATPEKL